MDAKTEESLKKLGDRYANGALSFFSAETKDSAALGELAVFFGTASSEMVAAMYDILHKHAGPKEAEMWLGQVLALIAAKVKGRGNPGVIEFGLKVENEPAPAGAVAPARAAAAALPDGT